MGGGERKIEIARKTGRGFSFKTHIKKGERSAAKKERKRRKSEMTVPKGKRDGHERYYLIKKKGEGKGP